MDERKDKGDAKAEEPQQEAPKAGTDGIVDATGSGVDGQKAQVTTAPSGKRGNFIVRIIGHVNVYFLLFLLVAVIGGGTVFVSFQLNKKQSGTTVNTQKLSQDALNKISNSEAKVGDAQQTLTIESNAIFTGKVLLKDSLDVAGALKVGGSLSLTGLNVAGQSSFDQVLVNRLNSTGDVAIQGQLTVQKNLTVSGGGSFAGSVTAPSLTVSDFQLTKDLQLQRHVEAGGGTPKVSRGPAVGNGGTVSINGSDTAGTVTVNIGGSPAAGILATVTFNIPFNTTPHIVVTPVGGFIQFYINRNGSAFSIVAAQTPPGGSISFDYIAFE
jgi:cytoskeletal protein CcmA (bactofilin family)